MSTTLAAEMSFPMASDFVFMKAYLLLDPFDFFIAESTAKSQLNLGIHPKFLWFPPLFASGGASRSTGPDASG
jgi:hypothetical protein